MQSNTLEEPQDDQNWRDWRSREQWSRQQSSLQCMEGFTSCPVPWGLEGIRATMQDEARAHQQDALRWWPAEWIRHALPAWWWGEQERKRGGSANEGQASVGHEPEKGRGCDRYQEQITVAGKSWIEREKRREYVCSYMSAAGYFQGQQDYSQQIFSSTSLFFTIYKSKTVFFFSWL